MRAHWIACIAGALLIALAAAARSAAREIAAPLEGLATLTSFSPVSPPVADAEPESLTDECVAAEEAMPIEEDESAPSSPGGAIGTLINDEPYTEARQSADLLEKDLLSSFPFTGDQAFKDLAEAQRSLLKTWIAWRRSSIDALPKDLQEESDHRRAIDEQFRVAIRGFLSEELAVSLDPGELDIDIINRPPVGGYDISGVGFTDIDELEEDFSDTEAGSSFVTRESARLETYNLREETFHTLIRMDPLTRSGIDPLSNTLLK
jgi:hypothetical protein